MEKATCWLETICQSLSCAPEAKVDVHHQDFEDAEEQAQRQLEPRAFVPAVPSTKETISMPHCQKFHHSGKLDYRHVAADQYVHQKRSITISFDEQVLSQPLRGISGSKCNGNKWDRRKRRLNDNTR